MRYTPMDIAMEMPRLGYGRMEVLLLEGDTSWDPASNSLEEDFTGPAVITYEVDSQEHWTATSRPLVQSVAKAA